ncbi:MAG: phosphoglycerate kinase [Patescibacteria group bacterium]
MKRLSQLKPSQLQNKICLLRVDLNIEFEEKDAFRLQAILPTIKFLIKNGAKVAILSHRGRPPEASSVKRQASGYTLRPFAKIISELLKKPVHFIDYNVFQKLKSEIENSPAGSIFLLENLRFFPEEEKNDKQFAKKLASLGDIYINDAFAVSHRANASVAAIAEFLPSYAGLVLEKEIENLDAIMKDFKKPLIIILGGAKVSDKVGLIDNFSKKADYFLIGGAMANTFFVNQGLPMGDSLYDKKVDLAGLSRRLGRKIILPLDLVSYRKQILDIGPETINNYQKFIQSANTIVWNGPAGFIENKKFAKGTEEIAKAIRQLADKNKKAKIAIGGGETINALKAISHKLKANVFLSTGGGAMLEYLAGKKLPGIQALEK